MPLYRDLYFQSISLSVISDASVITQQCSLCQKARTRSTAFFFHDEQEVTRRRTCTNGIRELASVSFSCWCGRQTAVFASALSLHYIGSAHAYCKNFSTTHAHCNTFGCTKPQAGQNLAKLPKVLVDLLRGLVTRRASRVRRSDTHSQRIRRKPKENPLL